MVPVQPKTLAALRLLLRRHGDAITREEFGEALWPGVSVTGNALDQVIGRIRKVLDDTGRPRRFVATVPRVGFRWVGGTPTLETVRPKARPALRRFVARRQAIESLYARMGDGPLITVTGPAGVGKTALVQQVAALQGLDPIWVDLSQVRTESGVFRAVVAAAGLASPADPELAIARLTSSDRLVVFDSPEPVLDCVVDLLGRWFERQGPLVIVTSRERLGLDVEHVIELGPLSQTDAIDLLQREQHARGGRPIDEPTSAALVDAVDRLPLGIALVAGAARLFTPETLRTKLETSVGWLWVDVRGRPNRQQTLEQSFRWSWELLLVEERDWVVQCSVFRAPFTVAAAMGVLGEAALPVVYALHERHVLHRDTETGRLQLYRPVREIVAQSDAPLDPSIIDRHASWFVSEQEDARSAGTWRGRTAADVDELWAAWERVTDHALKVRVALSLIELCHHFQIEPRLDQVVRDALALGSREERAAVRMAQIRATRSRQHASDDREHVAWIIEHSPPETTTALEGHMWMAQHQLEVEGDVAASRWHAQRGVALAEPGTVDSVRAQGHFGTMLLHSGDVEDGVAQLTEALRLARRLAADRVEAALLVELSNARLRSGQVHAAEALARAAIAVNRAEGHVLGIAQGLNTLALVLIEAHRVGEAAHCLDEALALAGSCPTVRADLLVSMAEVHALKDERRQARWCVEEALSQLVPEGRHGLASYAYVILAGLEWVENRLEPARTAAHRAEHHASQGHGRLHIVENAQAILAVIGATGFEDA